MKSFAIIALVGIASAANALILDDFVDGNVNDQISSGGNKTYTAATVPGGNRYINHLIESNPLNLTHSTVVVNGIFASDSKTLVDAWTVIGYGTEADGTFSVSKDLNLNLSSQNAFRINVLSNDQPATIQGVVRTNSGVQIFSSIYAVTPNMVLIPQTIDISFADFLGADFSDVDTIGFIINTSDSGDIVIDSFEAVPEPATMIALGLGVAALAKRRRKA